MPASTRSSERAITANVPAEIVQTPAARPSTPSVKFTTFITATIARPVRIAPPVVPRSTEPRNGSVNASTRTPAATGIAAAAICPISFRPGGSSRTSSIAPTRPISSAPPRMPRVSAFIGMNATAETSNPARIANPPSSGTGESWRLRSRGRSTAPTRTASLPVSGVRTSVTTAATAKAATASSSFIRRAA
jgi:hypothetical protein